MQLLLEFMLLKDAVMIDTLSLMRIQIVILITNEVLINIKFHFEFRLVDFRSCVEEMKQKKLI